MNATYELQYRPDYIEVVGATIRSLQDAQDFAALLLQSGEALQRRLDIVRKGNALAASVAGEVTP